ncbi:MAG: hypothetical protein IIC91_01810 [Chloroflexi bacterium]|nr:hypothetical protein [Chloroflexota bacterium]
MEPELTSLESFDLWMSIAVAGVTIVAILIGGSAAFWKFVLQQPYGNKFDIRLTPCRARIIRDQTGKRTVAYTVTLLVENQSGAAHKIAWWRRLRFPDEVEADYDPDGSFTINTDTEACERYGGGSGDEDYSLAPGEIYSDQLFRTKTGDEQQICYIEYTVKSARWFRRRSEYKSQTLIAPIEYEKQQQPPRRTLLERLGLG